MKKIILFLMAFMMLLSVPSCIYADGLDKDSYYIGADAFTYKKIIAEDGTKQSVKATSSDFEVASEEIAYDDANSVYLNLIPGHFILYRKTQGKKKWVKVKEFYVDPNANNRYDNDGYIFKEIYDKNLKAATKYSYKLYLKENDCYSNEMTYYTAPKKSKKTIGKTYISWKKSKKADGYLVDYNITYDLYGDKSYASLYYLPNYIKLDKNTTRLDLKLKEPDSCCICNVYVIPYIKVDGYYYADGCEIVSDWSDMEVAVL